MLTDSDSSGQLLRHNIIDRICDLSYLFWKTIPCHNDRGQWRLGRKDFYQSFCRNQPSLHDAEHFIQNQQITLVHRQNLLGEHEGIFIVLLLLFLFLAGQVIVALNILLKAKDLDLRLQTAEEIRAQLALEKLDHCCTATCRGHLDGIADGGRSLAVTLTVIDGYLSFLHILSCQMNHTIYCINLRAALLLRESHSGNRYLQRICINFITEIP